MIFTTQTRRPFLWDASCVAPQATYPDSGPDIAPRSYRSEANFPLCRPYSVLLPVGFAMPSLLLETRCALTAPFHPYLIRRSGGSFSVALSLGSPPPGVIRHRMSMEPGLSSPATFRSLPERPSGRLTPEDMGVIARPVKPNAVSSAAGPVR